MIEKTNKQNRRQFLKNIFRNTIFIGFVGIGFVTINKKGGSSTTPELCLQQGCGNCSLFTNCDLSKATSFWHSIKTNKQKITVYTGK